MRMLEASLKLKQDAYLLGVFPAVSWLGDIHFRL